MDNTALIARLNMLAQQLDHAPDDLHEVHFKVKEMIAELRATGMTVPDDLLEFDRELTRRVEGASG